MNPTRSVCSMYDAIGGNETVDDGEIDVPASAVNEADARSCPTVPHDMRRLRLDADIQRRIARLASHPVRPRHLHQPAPGLGPLRDAETPPNTTAAVDVAGAPECSPGGPIAVLLPATSRPEPIPPAGIKFPWGAGRGRLPTRTDGASNAELEKMHRTRPLNVMVVEDDTLLRRSAMDMLDDLGHNAVEASNGVAALKMLDAHKRIQVMMVDVKLSGMDGRELAEIARGLRSDLRIVFATGLSSERLGHFVADPMARYLPKPYRLRDLESALNSLRMSSISIV